MKQIETLEVGEHFTAVDMGSLDELPEYSLIHPVNKQEIRGKVFLKDALNATGSEISFNSLPPETEQPYFHLHRKNEETYMILSGHGFFQVDEACFEIKEGSVIHVLPNGMRSICNASKETMVYIVVQAKEHSLEEYTTDDGERVPYEAKW